MYIYFDLCIYFDISFEFDVDLDLDLEFDVDIDLYKTATFSQGNAKLLPGKQRLSLGQEGGFELEIFVILFCQTLALLNLGGAYPVSLRLAAC